MKVSKSFLSVLLTWTFIFSGAIPARAEVVAKDPKAAAIYALDSCKDPSELDCIESFSVLSGDDLIETPMTYSGFSGSRTSTDSYGNTEHHGNSDWKVETKSGPKNYSVYARLEAVNHIWGIYNGKKSRAGAIRIFVQGNEQDFETKVRIRVRTSWLKPLNVALYADQANFVETKIAGGRLWTFDGVRAKNSSYRDDWIKKSAANANADHDGSSLTFLVDHAATSATSYYSTKCASKGYTAEASNATAAGQPSWNPKTKSLEFSIFAPHADTKGNLNKGFFQLWVNKAYIQCAWPSSGLAKANDFSVSVYNEDGSRQVATTVVSYKRGQLKVAAYNFHYSSPTIRLKAKK